MDREALIEFLKEEMELELSISGQYRNALCVEIKIGGESISSDIISVSEFTD